MTAAGALVRLITILIVAAALPCRAEDVISGRWEGTAQIPDDELTVLVDLAQDNGAWVGSIIIPGLGLKGVPLTDIKVQPPHVSFAVKGPLGIQLKLRIDANNKMAGNFEQAGNRAPATLQKTGPPQVEYPPRNTPVAKELEGEWKVTTKCSVTPVMCRSSLRITQMARRRTLWSSAGSTTFCQ